MIYLDNNATTRVSPEVVQAMLPFLTERWGNPSSAYSFGHRLGEAIQKARSEVADLIGAEAGQIIFTSCGTESNNAALHSGILADPGKRHVITTSVEHSATLKFTQFLQKQGCSVTYLGVNSSGELDLDQLNDAIRPDTALVSAMWANNETGILFPVQQIGEICRSRGVPFHTDAVQVAGKLPVNVQEAQVDMLSLSGHKLYAPKGVGALYVHPRLKFQPFILGGGQERGRRGGTENVANIVAFGRAAGLAKQRLIHMERVSNLRDKLEQSILECVPGVERNGAYKNRLPNTTNLFFSGVEAEGVLMLLDQVGICASSGSACATGSLEPSHVLVAMGCSADRARSSLRFSLGIDTTSEDIDNTLGHLPRIIETLRMHSPA